MFVKSLQLKNFRNYKEENFNFNDGINVIYGKNAQGKTNLVEALYFLSIGKSFKNVKESELVNFESKSSFVKLDLSKNEGDISIEANVYQNQKKELKVNGAKLTRTGELLGNLITVFFSPNDLKLIKEAPGDRRRFIDISICQLSKSYFNLLSRYQEILKNRNELLKNKKDMSVINDTISIWDFQLSETAKKIITQRIKFVKLLNEYANKAHKYLTFDKEELSISYQGITDEDENKIGEEILKKLKENFNKDLILGSTSVGPHRDDLVITINGKDVKHYASQGQQRTAALSLKLAEKEILKQKINEYPILILDDVFSELDDNRKNRLLKFLSKGQTFITTTDEIDFGNKIKIENGKQV